MKSEEIDRIAGFLGIPPEDFISEFCEEKQGRFHLKTGGDDYCIFLHRGKNCRIHPVKPRICGLWPFYEALLKDEETWEAAKDACPGLNTGCSHEDFLRQSKK